jgi:2-dehydro-3-deoxygluconokinase
LFACLKLARRAGKKIAFDPNLRPRLWSDKKEMCDVIMAGANLSDIILPSFEDEATWFSDANPKATLKRYQKVGAEIVVVKNAGEPVSFISNQGIGTYPVQSIETVIDSTAAGDSFNSEILVGILRNIPLSEAISNGANLAKKVIMGHGALIKSDI